MTGDPQNRPAAEQGGASGGPGEQAPWSQPRPMSSQGPIFSPPPTTPKMSQEPPSPSSPAWSGDQNDMPTEFFSDETVAGAALPPDVSAMGAGVPPAAPHSVDPEHLVRPQMGEAIPPGPPHKKLAYLWHKDPAYKVLFIAIGAILLCSIVGATLLFAAFSGGQGPQQGGTTATVGQNATPTSTPNSNGNGQQATPVSSPTVAATPTAQPSPTPTAAPSPTPTATPSTNNGTLTVQIVNAPASVNNHSTVPIVINANKPGTTVRLTIFYFGAQPVTAQAGPQTVDANGNATLYWSINESGFGTFFKNNITARLTASAQDQNGNTASSQVVTVQVNMR